MIRKWDRKEYTKLKCQWKFHLSVHKEGQAPVPEGQGDSLFNGPSITRENSAHWPASSCTRTPFSHAIPNVYGLQWHWHLVPSTEAMPPFWQGWQWQGSDSSRYSSRARFRYSLFTEAQGTSLTSSYKGVSYIDKHITVRGVRWEYFLFGI